MVGEDRFKVSYKQIFTIVISFALGIIVILILQNTIRSEIITFSTVGFISFLFSIALSSVSIFLAVTAIMLSRLSEKAIIERSEAGIKLQRDTHLKTVETLQKIAISTGSTEKRIDDIAIKILRDNIPGNISPKRHSYYNPFKKEDLKSLTVGELNKNVRK